jgi:transposase
MREVDRPDRKLARRRARLSVEIADLEALLTPLVGAINPALTAAHGVGTDVAGQLLSPPGTTPTGCVPRPRSPSAASNGSSPASSTTCSPHRRQFEPRDDP